MTIKVPTVRDLKAVSLPSRQTLHAAGHDLCAVLDAPYTLEPMARHVFSTGLRMALPPGCAGLICPRSGLALKHGVTVLNAPGIIDADYRGDIGVILANFGDKAFTVHPGDRIAQIVFVHALDTLFIPAMGLSATARGEAGFGSTGVSAPATRGNIVAHEEVV
jgi:dUTP pyrophosphatase